MSCHLGPSRPASTRLTHGWLVSLPHVSGRLSRQDHSPDLLESHFGETHRGFPQPFQTALQPAAAVSDYAVFVQQGNEI